MGLRKWCKKGGKWVIKKISKSAVGRAAKYAFWGILAFYGPGPVIATVGIRGLLVAGMAAHSGIVEYTAGKIVDKTI